MSMLTKLYGHSNSDSSPTAVPHPNEAAPADKLGDVGAANEDRTSDSRTFDDAIHTVNRGQVSASSQDIDVLAYYRALDQIKSAFGDMHERLTTSHEATVNLSAEALQHMSALHKLEDELSMARHHADVAAMQITDLTERLAQEMDRSAALEQQVESSERELQGVISRNHELETLFKEMHQGLMNAFAGGKLS